MCHFLSLPGTFRLQETPLNPYEKGFGDVKPPQVGFCDLGPKRTDQCDNRPLLCDGIMDPWAPAGGQKRAGSQGSGLPSGQS